MPIDNINDPWRNEEEEPEIQSAPPPVQQQQTEEGSDQGGLPEASREEQSRVYLDALARSQGEERFEQKQKPEPEPTQNEPSPNDIVEVAGQPQQETQEPPPDPYAPTWEQKHDIRHVDYGMGMDDERRARDKLVDQIKAQVRFARDHGQDVTNEEWGDNEQIDAVLNGYGVRENFSPEATDMLNRFAEHVGVKYQAAKDEMGRLEGVVNTAKNTLNPNAIVEGWAETTKTLGWMTGSVSDQDFEDYLLDKMDKDELSRISDPGKVEGLKDVHGVLDAFALVGNVFAEQSSIIAESMIVAGLSAATGGAAAGAFGGARLAAREAAEKAVRKAAQKEIRKIAEKKALEATARKAGAAAAKAATEAAARKATAKSIGSNIGALVVDAQFNLGSSAEQRMSEAMARGSTHIDKGAVFGQAAGRTFADYFGPIRKMATRPFRAGTTIQQMAADGVLTDARTFAGGLVGAGARYAKDAFGAGLSFEGETISDRITNKVINDTYLLNGERDWTDAIASDLETFVKGGIMSVTGIPSLARRSFAEVQMNRAVDAFADTNGAAFDNAFAKSRRERDTFASPGFRSLDLTSQRSILEMNRLKAKLDQKNNLAKSGTAGEIGEAAGNAVQIQNQIDKLRETLSPEGRKWVDAYNSQFNRPGVGMQDFDKAVKSDPNVAAKLQTEYVPDVNSVDDVVGWVSRLVGKELSYDNIRDAANENGGLAVDAGNVRIRIDDGLENGLVVSVCRIDGGPMADTFVSEFRQADFAEEGEPVDSSDAFYKTLQAATGCARKLSSWAKWSDARTYGRDAAFANQLAQKSGRNVTIIRSARDLVNEGLVDDRGIFKNSNERVLGDLPNGLNGNWRGVTTADGHIYVNASAYRSPAELAAIVDHESFHSRIIEMMQNGVGEKEAQKVAADFEKKTGKPLSEDNLKRAIRATILGVELTADDFAGLSNTAIDAILERQEERLAYDSEGMIPLKQRVPMLQKVFRNVPIIKNHLSRYMSEQLGRAPETQEEMADYLFTVMSRTKNDGGVAMIGVPPVKSLESVAAETNGEGPQNGWEQTFLPTSQQDADAARNTTPKATENTRQALGDLLVNSLKDGVVRSRNKSLVQQLAAFLRYVGVEVSDAKVDGAEYTLKIDADETVNALMYLLAGNGGESGVSEAVNTIIRLGDAIDKNVYVDEDGSISFVDRDAEGNDREAPAPEPSKPEESSKPEPPKEEPAPTKPAEPKPAENPPAPAKPKEEPKKQEPPKKEKSESGRDMGYPEPEDAYITPTKGTVYDMGGKSSGNFDMSEIFNGLTDEIEKRAKDHPGEAQIVRVPVKNGPEGAAYIEFSVLRKGDELSVSAPRIVDASGNQVKGVATKGVNLQTDSQQVPKKTLKNTNNAQKAEAKANKDRVAAAADAIQKQLEERDAAEKKTLKKKPEAVAPAPAPAPAPAAPVQAEKPANVPQPVESAKAEKKKTLRRRSVAAAKQEVARAEAKRDLRGESKAGVATAFQQRNAARAARDRALEGKIAARGVKDAKGKNVRSDAKQGTVSERAEEIAQQSIQIAGLKNATGTDAVLDAARNAIINAEYSSAGPNDKLGAIARIAYETRQRDAAAADALVNNGLSRKPDVNNPITPEEAVAAKPDTIDDLILQSLSPDGPFDTLQEALRIMDSDAAAEAHGPAAVDAVLRAIEPLLDLPVEEVPPAIAERAAALQDRMDRLVLGKSAGSSENQLSKVRAVRDALAAQHPVKDFVSKLIGNERALQELNDELNRRNEKSISADEKIDNRSKSAFDNGSIVDEEGHDWGTIDTDTYNDFSSQDEKDEYGTGGSFASEESLRKAEKTGLSSRNMVQSRQRRTTTNGIQRPEEGRTKEVASGAKALAGRDAGAAADTATRAVRNSGRLGLAARIAARVSAAVGSDGRTGGVDGAVQAGYAESQAARGELGRRLERLVRQEAVINRCWAAQGIEATLRRQPRLEETELFGSETSTIFKDKAANQVFKVTRASYADPTAFWYRMALFNSAFGPDTGVGVLGYGLNELGEFSIIGLQQYVEKDDAATAKLTPQRIFTYLKTVFGPNLRKTGDYAFETPLVTIRDAGPGNVVVDKQGRIRVIDIDIDPKPALKDAMTDRFGREQARFASIDSLAAARIGIGGFADAEQMEREGADRTAIWKKTGWWRGRDGKWRVEVDDSDLVAFAKAVDWSTDSGSENFLPKTLLDKLAELKWADVMEEPTTVSLTFREIADAIESTGNSFEVFQAYPDAANVEVSITIDPNQRASGSTDGDSAINVVAPNMDRAIEVLAHERQHIIQDIAGMAVGTSSIYNTEDGYLNSAGEVEARNTARRLRMTLEERAATPPWETEDVEESEQIVRFASDESLRRSTSDQLTEDDRVASIASIRRGATDVAERQSESYNEGRVPPVSRRAETNEGGGGEKAPSIWSAWDRNVSQKEIDKIVDEYLSDPEDISVFVALAYFDRQAKESKNKYEQQLDRYAYERIKSAASRSKFNPNATSLRIADGGVSLDDAKRVFEKLNADKDIGRLASLVFDAVRDYKLDIRVDDSAFASERDGVTGLETYGHIDLRSSYLRSPFVSDQTKAITIIHEMIHAMTQHAIDGVTAGIIKDEQIVKAVRSMKEVYDAAIESGLIDDFNGSENVHEFYSYLTKPSFREALSQKPTLIQRAIRALRDLVMAMIGRSPAVKWNQSLLDAAESALGRLLSTDSKTWQSWFFSKYGMRESMPGGVLAVRDTSVPSGVQKSAGVNYPDAGAEISAARFASDASLRAAEGGLTGNALSDPNIVRLALGPVRVKNPDGTVSFATKVTDIIRSMGYLTEEPRFNPWPGTQNLRAVYAEAAAVVRKDPAAAERIKEKVLDAYKKYQAGDKNAAAKLSISAHEVQVLRAMLIISNQALVAANDAVENAENNGADNLEELRVAELNAEAQYYNALLTCGFAERAIGTALGSLARLMENDFSMGGLLKKLGDVDGGVTAEDAKKLRGVSREGEAAQKKHDDAVKAIEEEERKKLVAGKVDDAVGEGRRNKAAGRKARTVAEAVEAARKELADGEMVDISVYPELWAQIGDAVKGIARAIIGEHLEGPSRLKALDHAAFARRLLAETNKAFEGRITSRDENHKELTERDVLDLFSDYGDPEKLQEGYGAADIGAGRLREAQSRLKKLSQMMSALEDIKAGKAPLEAYGHLRDLTPKQVDEEMERVKKEMDEAWRASGLDKNLLHRAMSPLELVREGIEKRIAEIKANLAAGELAKKQGRKPIAGEEGLADLREELKRLQSIQDSVFKNRGLTDEQRLAAIEENYRRTEASAMATLQRLMAGGRPVKPLDMSDDGARSAWATAERAWRQKIGEARRAAADATRRLNEIRQRMTPESYRGEKALERAIARREDMTARWEEAVNAGRVTLGGRGIMRDPKMRFDPRLVEADRAYREVIAKRDRLFAEIKYDHAKGWEKLKMNLSAIPNTMRQMLASGDNSGIGVQCAVATLANPKDGIKAVFPGIKVFWNTLLGDGMATERYMESLYRDPDFERIAAYVEIPRTDGKGNFTQDSTEEFFQHGVVAERLAGRLNKYLGTNFTKPFGRYMKASEVGFNVPVAMIRFELAKRLIAHLRDMKGEGYTPTNEEMSLLGKVVNAATGRGKFLSGGGPIDLSNVFWASGRVSGQVESLFLPARLFLKHGEVDLAFRKKIARELIWKPWRNFAAAALLFGLAHAIFKDEDDDDPFMELDPTSSKFLRMKVGTRYFDITSGMPSYITLAAKGIWGEKKTVGGKRVALRGQGAFGQSWSNELWRFFRNKLRPEYGNIISLFDGRNAIGEEIEPTPLGVSKFLTVNGFLPLTAKDIVDSIEDFDRNGPLFTASLAFLANLGYTTSNFGQTPYKNDRAAIETIEEVRKQAEAGVEGMDDAWSDIALNEHNARYIKAASDKQMVKLAGRIKELDGIIRNGETTKDRKSGRVVSRRKLTREERRAAEREKDALEAEYHERLWPELKRIR